MKKTFQMTQEGKEQLENELDVLLTQKRAEVIERIQIAREFGDLSENSEYDSARDEQATIEARISTIENMIKNAEIIEKKASEVIGFGSVVTYVERESKNEEVFQIVGIAEADPFENKISTDSPVAQALSGHKSGDKVSFILPNGNEMKLEITKVE